MMKIIFISSLPFLSVFVFLFTMITESLVWADMETFGDHDIGGKIVV